MAEELILRVSHDSDVENPLEHTGWKLVSFSNRHANYESRDTVMERYCIAARFYGAKLKREPGDRPEQVYAGTFFTLTYFEHGNCLWSLSGEGPNCRFDSVRFAGLLIHEGDVADLPDTLEERRETAQGIVETYSAYCNGFVYGYQLFQPQPACEMCGIPPEPEAIGSCWGFYDAEHMMSHVRSEAAPDGATFKVTGDAAFFVEDHL